MLCVVSRRYTSFKLSTCSHGYVYLVSLESYEPSGATIGTGSATGLLLLPLQLWGLKVSMNLWAPAAVRVASGSPVADDRYC
jgi:hypothetical protein